MKGWLMCILYHVGPLLFLLMCTEGCDIPVLYDSDFIVDVYEYNQLRLTWNGTNYDKVTWYFFPNDKSKVQMEFPFPFCDSDNVCFTVDNGRTLIITHTPLEARGVFLCEVACTRTGETKNISMDVSVHACGYPPPPNIFPTSNVTVLMGGEATLNCTVDFHCYAPIYDQQLVWGWNHTDIENGTEGITMNTDITNENDEYMYSSQLIIHNVTEHYFHHPFYCGGRTIFGSHEIEIYLYRSTGLKLGGGAIEEQDFRPVVLAAVIAPFLTVAILVVILHCFRTHLMLVKRSVIRDMKSCFRNVEKGNEDDPPKQYDVFLYHNDSRDEEVKDIQHFLIRNGYIVKSGIEIGHGQSSVREIIEESASIICIADEYEILKPILIEATEEILASTIIIYTKDSRDLNTSLLNVKCLDYPYSGETCFCWRKSVFYLKLKLCLPFPLNTNKNIQNVEYVNDRDVLVNIQNNTRYQNFIIHV